MVEYLLEFNVSGVHFLCVDIILGLQAGELAACKRVEEVVVNELFLCYFTYFRLVDWLPRLNTIKGELLTEHTVKLLALLIRLLVNGLVHLGYQLLNRFLPVLMRVLLYNLLILFLKHQWRRMEPLGKLLLIYFFLFHGKIDLDILERNVRHFSEYKSINLH